MKQMKLNLSRSRTTQWNKNFRRPETAAVVAKSFRINNAFASTAGKTGAAIGWRTPRASRSTPAQHLKPPAHNGL
jgi:hypothetical protein